MSRRCLGPTEAHSDRSLRPLFLSILPGNQREVNKLRDMREKLANDISECIDEFGPKLYENFNQVSYPPDVFCPEVHTEHEQADNTGPYPTLRLGPPIRFSPRHVYPQISLCRLFRPIAPDAVAGRTYIRLVPLCWRPSRVGLFRFVRLRRTQPRQIPLESLYSPRQSRRE